MRARWLALAALAAALVALAECECADSPGWCSAGDDAQ